MSLLSSLLLIASASAGNAITDDTPAPSFAAIGAAEKKAFLESALKKDGSLPAEDLACGFRVDSADMLSVCMDTLARVTEPATTVHDIRLHCGQDLMKFVGAGKHASEKKCTELGGKWGKRAAEVPLKLRPPGRP